MAFATESAASKAAASFNGSREAGPVSMYYGAWINV